MIPRHQAPPEILRLLNAQAGVISRQQANGLGMSDTVIHRLLSERRWTMIANGIYCVESEPSWLALAWAGILLGGPRSVLGGAAAAYLQHITREPPSEIPVFVGAAKRQVDGPWRWIRGDRTATGNPPRTPLCDTILDYCLDLDEDSITTVLADALTARRVTSHRLARALEKRSRYAHRRLFVDILSDVSLGAHSALERRYARDVERAHGLPRGERQQRTAAHHRCDVWYRDYGLIVELDGHEFHGGGRAFRDRARDNDHHGLGLLTLRFGWHEVVADPCQVARRVALVLSEHGWNGVATPCSRCRRLHLV